MASNEEMKQDEAQELPAPAGWIKKLTPKKGSGAKNNNIVFISPDGEEIKNKRQLEQYLKSHPGGPAVSEFYWGTGDTPRRSARLGEKSKTAEAPGSESPKKKQKISSTNEGDVEKNGEGEATDDKDAAEEKEGADKDTAAEEKEEGAVKDAAAEDNREGAQDVGASEIIAKPDIEGVDKETKTLESLAVEIQNDETNENTDPKVEKTTDSKIEESKGASTEVTCEKADESKDAEKETPPEKIDIAETIIEDPGNPKEKQEAEEPTEKDTVPKKPAT